jgi:hypothetical protein
MENLLAYFLAFVFYGYPQLSATDGISGFYTAFHNYVPNDGIAA